MDNLSFGQRIDQENGLCELWLTHGALDWIKQQDWSDKVVWMFGAGLGDAWLARRCKWLHVVERNNEWAFKASVNCANNNSNNVTYHHRPCNDSSGADEMYCDIPYKVDVIINDDAYRTEICQVAVDYFKANGGGIFISDNWIQSYVWLSPKAEEIMQPYEAMVFEQHDHKDNDGVNKWKTAVWNIK